ncbi:MAG: RluA family pseudouridine synthase [Treponema sp.]|jgi:23S rRNA pseudouridine1911/1915/1917 synthase|nr:RluA family pseudouridine synthase [Treponema sp.]
MPVFSGIVEDTAGLRLDRYVSEYLGLLSRSQVRSRSMSALVNGKQVKRSRVVKTGDSLELSWEEAENPNVEPQDIPLTVLYEDPRVIVIDKAQGMVVHPGAGNHSGTLVNALLFRRMAAGAPPALPVPGDPFRPGIVHRLDKDTSGVMICAWDAGTLAFLSEQFKTRKVRKRYVAILRGVPAEESGRIKTLLCRDSRDRKRFTVGERGKEALSYFKIIRSWASHSLVLLYPRTGRTHQLRVQMAWLGYPIVGDPLYGSRDRLFPGAAMMLHAKNLSISLPGEHERRIFSSPLPDRFRSLIRILDTRAGRTAASYPRSRVVEQDN